MSFFPAKDPVLGDAFSCDAVEMAIVPRTVTYPARFMLAAAMNPCRCGRARRSRIGL